MSRISGKSEKIEKEEGDGSRVAVGDSGGRYKRTGRCCPAMANGLP